MITKPQILAFIDLPVMKVGLGFTLTLIFMYLRESSKTSLTFSCRMRSLVEAKDGLARQLFENELWH